VTNEKGLVASAARLPGAPPDFAARAGALCAGHAASLGLSEWLAEAEALLADVRTPDERRVLSAE
jgi:hypothetical protein